MILTQKQEEGLSVAVKRYQDGEKYTVIRGYAGTGKSTLVKFIIRALNIDPERVCYATFTGKAAEVLRKKGNENAMTLHRLLYDHFPKPDGGFTKIPKKELPYKIIVVDEISMVPQNMVDLLFKHNCYVICLGDPFQLPPIDKDNSNDLLSAPHVFLTEVMRQAAESEIIRLSMDIRAGKQLTDFNGKEAKVFSKKDYVPSMLTWADQVIVATNKARVNYNASIRNMLGKGDLPEEGDKMICLRNYWDDVARNGDPLVNGSIGYLTQIEEKTIYVPRFARASISSIDCYSIGVESSEGAVFSNINIDKDLLINGVSKITPKDSYLIGRLKGKVGDILPKEFAYGYAITCHKRQGSEWDKVLVMEESFPFAKEEHARWLYTAVTRASDKLVLIRK